MDGDQVRMRQGGTYLPGRFLPIGDIHTYIQIRRYNMLTWFRQVCI